MPKNTIASAGANKIHTDQTRETLEQAQARADALFQSIGVGAIATNEDGKIYRINKLALDILGYQRSEVIEKWFPKIVQATDKDGVKVSPINRPMTQAFLTGKPVSAKTYYKSKNGDNIPVSLTVSPILLQDRPIGAIEVFYDSTLENEVDRMKSEFISIASHQLRTPLSAINTYASMLSSGYKGELNDSQQEDMRIILSAVERMNELITNLLDISQLEAGALNVRLKETNLTQLLKRTLDQLNQFAATKEIDLTTDLLKDDIVIQCDPLLLGEIYSNLISNALKYTPQKGKVTISLKKEKQEVKFMVEDNGYGIPRQLQDQVFTKFFRASNIQKLETTGTGLGLYMVKQIAEVMNGRLWFKSREDKGSIFCFALPIELALPDAD
jgi:PAS domain S-box-containing protein